jgi:hypothetical protein
MEVGGDIWYEEGCRVDMGFDRPSLFFESQQQRQECYSIMVSSTRTVNSSRTRSKTEKHYTAPKWICSCVNVE